MLCDLYRVGFEDLMELFKTALVTSAHRRDTLRAARWGNWVALGCGLGSICLAWCQSWWYVFHPHYLPLGFLLLGLAISTCVALACSLWNMVRGPGRLRAIGFASLAIIPAGMWAWVGYSANENYKQRWVPNSFTMRVAGVMGVTLMRGVAGFEYSKRMESDRLIMLSHEARGLERDLAAMDEHIKRLEEILGAEVGKKIYWIRGDVIGQRFVSLHGLALGSEPQIDRDDSPMYRGDRHELAHAVLDYFRVPGSDPPNVLHEGWGMAQCGDTSRLLARDAAKARDDDPTLGIRALFGSQWYHRGSGPVYQIGGAFVDFLLRTRGGSNFRRFYVECSPNNFDEKCREIYGIELDELEVEFWHDVRRQTELSAENVDVPA
jgi:hypothetical protein